METQGVGGKELDRVWSATVALRISFFGLLVKSAVTGWKELQGAIC